VGSNPTEHQSASAKERVEARHTLLSLTSPWLKAGGIRLRLKAA
jgi:hypothetical protein